MDTNELGMGLPDLPQSQGNPALQQLQQMMAMRRALPPSPIEQERQRALEGYQESLRTQQVNPHRAFLDQVWNYDIDPFQGLARGQAAYDAALAQNMKQNIDAAKAGYTDAAARAALESQEDRAFGAKMVAAGRGGAGVKLANLGNGVIEVVDAATGAPVRRIDQGEATMALKIINHFLDPIMAQGGVDATTARQIALGQALSAVGQLRGGQASAVTSPVTNDVEVPPAPAKAMSAPSDVDDAQRVAKELVELIAKVNQATDPAASVAARSNIDQITQYVKTSMAPEKQQAVAAAVRQMMGASAAAPTPQVSPDNATMKGYEERERLKGQGRQTGEEGVKAIYDEYAKVKDLPSNIATFNQAMQSWAKSKDQFGAGAEFFNNAKSFLNNRLGLGIDKEKVADAQMFAAAMDRFAAAQLRQTDSQPALKQLEMLRKAIGTLENDPEAVPKILQHLHKLAEIQAEGFNRRVSAAEANGFKPMAPMQVVVPPLAKKFYVHRPTGRMVVEYSDGRKEFAE